MLDVRKQLGVSYDVVLRLLKEAGIPQHSTSTVKRIAFHIRSFTEDERKFIKDNFLVITLKQMADTLDRPVCQIKGEIRRLGLSRGEYRWTDERLQRLKDLLGKVPVKVIAKELQTRPVTIRQKASLLGIPTRVRDIFIHKENGYYVRYLTDGTRIFEHIYVVEQHIGRKLDSSVEHVHHINADKTDNRIENLWICTRSQHSRAHHSVTRLLPELMSRGVVTFNRETGLYETSGPANETDGPQANVPSGPSVSA